MSVTFGSVCIKVKINVASLYLAEEVNDCNIRLRLDFGRNITAFIS